MARPRRARGWAASARDALAGALVALGGPVVWGFLYGSDVALFMMLAVWLLLELSSGWPAERVGRVALVGVLMALARPEGLLIALALGAASLCAPGRRRDAAARALAWAPVLAATLRAGAEPGHDGLVGGDVDRGQVPGRDATGSRKPWRLAADFLVDVVRGLLLGFYPSQAPIGFSRGWASLVLSAGRPAARVADARPLGDPRLGPLRVWAGTRRARVPLVGTQPVHGHPFQSLPPLGVPRPAGAGGRGPARAEHAAGTGDARLDRRLFAAGAAALRGPGRPVDRPLRRPVR